jgi:hypothetical protein
MHPQDHALCEKWIVRVLERIEILKVFLTKCI